jgi:hypothetical protein
LERGGTIIGALSGAALKGGALERGGTIIGGLGGKVLGGGGGGGGALELGIQ